MVTGLTLMTWLARLRDAHVVLWAVALRARKYTLVTPFRKFCAKDDAWVEAFVSLRFGIHTLHTVARKATRRPDAVVREWVWLAVGKKTAETLMFRFVFKVHQFVHASVVGLVRLGLVPHPFLGWWGCHVDVLHVDLLGSGGRGRRGV